VPGCAASGGGWWWSRCPATRPSSKAVEPLWANRKGVELANLTTGTLGEVTAAAERGVQRIRATHQLPSSFLRHCGLSLW
jgi:hypothetical protein